MKELIIITDYKNEFLVSYNENEEYVSMNITKLIELFGEKCYHVRVIEYSKINLDEDFNNMLILYQSSEAIGQFYKHYILDILYYLKSKGAILLPKYEYLLSHHNKGFMELLRLSFDDEKLKTITSKYYGNPYEALREVPDFPVIIKRISGSGSYGVFCARNYSEYKKAIHKASKVVVGYGFINLIELKVKNFIKSCLQRAIKSFPKKPHEKPYYPIIVQNMIEGLNGDYKVLYFGGKYYTLFRKNRENDFRASGSGKFFQLDVEENIPLLNYARKIVNEIDFPIINMDIGFDGKNYHLFEFQMVHIGPYALQRSDYYFEYSNQKWNYHKSKSKLEEEFVRSICEYIDKNYTELIQE